jgi:hypothetical protein
MKFIGPILLSSIAVLYGLLCIAMAITGYRKGKVYYAAGKPPFIFNESPIKFMLWTAFLIVMSVICLSGAAILVGKMLSRV